MSSDFDSFLDKTVQRLGEDERVRQIALQDEEEQKKLFLRQFRDVAQRVALPVFNRVLARQTKQFRVEVSESPEAVSLHITITNQGSKDIRRALRLGAEHRTKRIYAAYDTEYGSSSLDTETLSPEEITEERVEELVRELIERPRR